MLLAGRASASPNTAKEPEYSFPGISAPAAKTAGKIYLGGSIATDTNNYASWDRWGIQCSRCHYATGAGDSGHAGSNSGGHTTFPVSGVSTGGDIVSLCMNCHRQETGGLPNALEAAGFLNASCTAVGTPTLCCTGSKTGNCNTRIRILAAHCILHPILTPAVSSPLSALSRATVMPTSS